MRLLHSFDEARVWIGRLFGQGVRNLEEPQPWSWGRGRVLGAARLFLKGLPPVSGPPTSRDWDLHHGYVLLQEFLPDNTFDTRVTVIGNRAFARRRFNRPNDFRASGSGKADVDPAKIDLGMVRLAFRVARRLSMQAVSIDGLWKGREAVVGEISYTCISRAVHDCPGHWALTGSPEEGELRWVEGPMWPEEAQIADFLVRLETHHAV